MPPDFYARYNGGLFGGGGGGGGSAPKANKVALSATDTSTAVVFTTAFTSTPVVVAWLTSSATPDIISLQGTSVSTAGFSAYYATQIPDGTYTLNWFASEVSDA